MSGSPDPKPTRAKRRPRRHIDRPLLIAAALRNPHCQAIGCGKRAGSVHHVIRKGAPHFGDDAWGNVLVLCGDGVDGCHGAYHANDREARRRIGLALTDRHIAYVHRKLGSRTAGIDYLERRYLLTEDEIVRKEP